MVTRAARLDDDDDIYDPRFPGKKVVRDGKGIRVPIQLTDGQPPEWMRTQRRPMFDARNHQPHFADVDSAELRDARLAAHDARQAYITRISDAWKVQPVGVGGADHTTAPGAEPGGDDDVESPRDAYIRQISTAWQRPMGQAPAASADNIAGLTRSWLSPGARPGPGPGYGDARPAVSRETATQDADADRETAYREYVDRISGAWRR